SKQIAQLLRGGNRPLAYAHPQGRRETRDLLRRRMGLVHERAEVVAPVVHTHRPYNRPPFGQKLIHAKTRQARQIPERFPAASVRKSSARAVSLLDTLDELIGDVELYWQRTVKGDDADTFDRLRSIPGVGKIRALVLRDELHDMTRLGGAGAFL